MITVVNKFCIPFLSEYFNDYINMDSHMIQIFVIVIIVASYASSGRSSIKTDPLINKRRLCMQMTSVSSSVTPLASLTLPDQQRCMMKCAHNKGCAAFKYTSYSKMCSLIPPVNIIRGDTAPQYQYSKLTTCRPTSLLSSSGLVITGGKETLG